MSNYSYDSCPACGHADYTETTTSDVVTCSRCGGLYSTAPIYLGESYRLVRPDWDNTDCPPAQQRYFDFICLGSEGITRRHGWYNPTTGRITQTG